MTKTECHSSDTVGGSVYVTEFSLRWTMYIQQPEISYSAKVVYMLEIIIDTFLLSIDYITEKHRTNVQHVVLISLHEFCVLH